MLKRISEASLLVSLKIEGILNVEGYQIAGTTVCANVSLKGYNLLRILAHGFIGTGLTECFILFPHLASTRKPRQLSFSLL